MMKIAMARKMTKAMVSKNSIQSFFVTVSAIVFPVLEADY